MAQAYLKGQAIVHPQWISKHISKIDMSNKRALWYVMVIATITFSVVMVKI